MDFRQTLRTLIKNPGFALAAIGILALGLAANTAVFSVADAVLFVPLGFHQPEQLVSIAESIPQFSNLYPTLPVNSRHFYEWQTRSRSFASLAILRSSGVNLTGVDGPPERLGVESVSWNLFPMLGVTPMSGRNFSEREDSPGNDRVVILTDALWRRRFHADPAILNQTILLNGIPSVVIGVLPPSFRFPHPELLSSGLIGSALKIDLFRPIAIDRARMQAFGNHNYNAIARLRPGVTVEQASAELNTVQAALAQELAPPGVGLRSVVTPLHDQIVSGARRGLLVLLASIGAVLLIMCVNLGNLMLARATARGREMAVRAALGASSWRMIRQVLTESLTIALAGGLVGTALAYLAVRLLVAAAPVNLPRLDEVHLDYRALLFAFACSLLAGLLFGVIPAWRAARAEPQDALRTGGRGSTQGPRGLRISELLVSAEVALSAALLVAAGLLVGSLVHLLGVDVGFHPDNVLTVGITFPTPKYGTLAKRSELVDRLIPALRSMPGVQAAGMITALPLQGETWVDVITRDDDHRPVLERPAANYRFVSPEYFKVLQIPVLQGRAFEPSDRNREVAIVSASTAARVWPGQNPVGKHVRRSNDDEPFWEVVGVAADTRAEIKGQPPLMVYQPYWKSTENAATLVIRTGQDAASAAPAVRRAIWSVDADLPVPEIKTMKQVVSDAVSQRRFQAVLLTGFAAGALILATIGIYGVISYAVNRRRNEIGIRMALGAHATDVRRMVLLQGMRPVLAGLVVGLAGALAFGRLLQSLLFEMRTTDPWVLAGVAVVLAAASLAACYAPARRATRVDPAIALRYE